MADTARGTNGGSAAPLLWRALDVGLSEYGRAQMAEVAAYLREERLAAIYASPRSRALESARILAAAHDCLVEVIPDLREIHFGDFEGLTYDEIAARYPDLYRRWMETPTEVRFPNGEEFAEMRARVLRAVDAIRCTRAGQTAAIVSHGGVNRILIAQALQTPDHFLFRLAQDHGAINLLSFFDESPSVQLVNYSAAVLAPHGLQQSNLGYRTSPVPIDLEGLARRRPLCRARPCPKSDRTKTTAPTSCHAASQDGLSGRTHPPDIQPERVIFEGVAGVDG